VWKRLTVVEAGGVGLQTISWMEVACCFSCSCPFSCSFREGAEVTVRVEAGGAGLQTLSWMEVACCFSCSCSSKCREQREGEEVTVL